MESDENFAAYFSDNFKVAADIFLKNQHLKFFNQPEELKPSLKSDEESYKKIGKYTELK